MLLFQSKSILKPLKLLQPLRWASHECSLKQILAEKIPQQLAEINKLREENGKCDVGNISIDALYNGMSGMPALIWETSQLCDKCGLSFRGLPLQECCEQLPKKICEPLPEGIFWLMLTGAIPNEDQVDELSADWNERATLPKYAVKVLSSLPEKLHPVAQLSAVVTAMSSQSKFASQQQKGVVKCKYWESTYEDCMDLIAMLPLIAAKIYQHHFGCSGHKVCTDNRVDWTTNFSRNLGFGKEPFNEMLRLYMTIHSDLAGCSVNSHATQLVGSALSDPYLAYAAGLNALPAQKTNQDVIIFLQNLIQSIGIDADTKKLRDYCENLLKTNTVIPGYGSEIFTKPDARFICLRNFTLKNATDDKLFALVQKLKLVLPKLLKCKAKMANPYPTVDAISGVLLQRYDIRDMQFYPVLFAIASAFGTLAQLIWSRALCFPIESPISVSTECLKQLTKKTKTECKRACK